MKQFIHHPNGKIQVNDTVVDLEVFKFISPMYKLPDGMIKRTYIPGVLHVLNDGKTDFPQEKQWTEGDVFIDRELELSWMQKKHDNDEIERKKIVDETKSKTKNYNERRKLEYPDLDDLIVALWEHIVEVKNKEESKIDLLQKIREDVKKKYQKEEKKKRRNKNET